VLKPRLSIVYGRLLEQPKAVCRKHTEKHININRKEAKLIRVVKI